MFVLIVGCGRVGSTVARSMLSKGHSVSCLDEDPESHARLEVGLDTSWEEAGGQFTVGTALETQALEGAGIIEADAFVAAGLLIHHYSQLAGPARFALRRTLPPPPPGPFELPLAPPGRNGVIR